jgi:hypothetical protein
MGEVLRRARAQNLERRGCSIFSRGVRQPVSIRERAPITFVANDGRVRTEYVAVTETGAVKDPMIRAMHGVATQHRRHVATDAVIAAASERDPGHGVLRSTEDDVGPYRRHLRLARSPHERVVFEESLVAHHHVVIVCPPFGPATSPYCPRRRPRCHRERRSLRPCRASPSTSTRRDRPTGTDSRRSNTSGWSSRSCSYTRRSQIPQARPRR